MSVTLYGKPPISDHNRKTWQQPPPPPEWQKGTSLTTSRGPAFSTSTPGMLRTLVGTLEPGHPLAYSTAPATKSILDLAKVLRLPRNSLPCETFARPCEWSRLRDHSKPVPNSFRDRLCTGVATWCARCPEAQFTHSANVSASCHPPPCESTAPATKSILDLAKVLRLPRNSQSRRSGLRF